VPSTLDATTAANTNGMGARRGVIYTIAPSPIRSGEIWAGTDDGKIWITADEGAHWRDVTPARLAPWSKVGIIEASAFDAGTAYAAIDRHRVDDIRPYILRTHDSGKTWTPIAGGIPTGAYVNAVREDPMRRGLLYAGTELGVYVSFDDGSSWRSLRLNMPVVPVRDLVIRQDSLAIATHGRSFWVLDDLSPLHQHTAAVDRSAAWLYAPETAIRVRPHSDPSERYPPEEPGGENREVGAFIDYVVNASSSAAQLSIFDAKGGLVRTYSSTAKAQSIDPNVFDFPAFWFTPEAPLSAATGIHRFVWDFHYAALPGEPSSGFGPASGPLAPPGRYEVKLTIGGRTWTQPLTLARDPRISASDKDLAAEFTLARQVEKAKLATILAFNQATKRKLKALAGGPGQTSPDNSLGAPQVEFTSLYAIGGALDNLENTVESADSAPTIDELRAFTHWQAALRTDLAVLAKHR
jgi:hypothetical protein